LSDIFDLVDSPELARMVHHVDRMTDLLELEEVKLTRLPAEVILPIFDFSHLESHEYCHKLALALMATAAANKRDLDGVIIYSDDLHIILDAVMYETVLLALDCMDIKPPACLMAKLNKKKIAEVLPYWVKTASTKERPKTDKKKKTQTVNLGSEKKYKDDQIEKAFSDILAHLNIKDSH